MFDISSEISRNARLSESYHFTHVLNEYMNKRLEQLHECKLQDKSEYEDIYEQRKVAMVMMVNDAIDHTIEMDNYFE